VPAKNNNAKRLETIKAKIAKGELPADYFKKIGQASAASRKAKIDELKELKRQVTVSKI
jgi:hypothetical protein